MKSKILYIAPTRSSFVQTDIKFLQKNFVVKYRFFNWSNKLLLPFTFLKQSFWLITTSKNCKAYLVSFGGFWSIVPSIFGKMMNIPVFIILNGTDCASLPTLNYGSLRKPLVKLSCLISYKLAYRLLPVSETLVKTVNTYYKFDQNQGYKYFFPSIKTPFSVIPNGLDTSFWIKDQKIEKEPNSFITVFNPPQFILKGGDIIMKLALLLPNCNFYICGTSIPDTSIPKNVKFLGKLSQKELRVKYSQAQFHFQLSIFEGFGVSLCEAMLCECIPIGSNVNEIPNIIGDAGFIVDICEINTILETVKKGLAISDKKKFGHIARNRIIKNYSIENRTKTLNHQLKNSQN